MTLLLFWPVVLLSKHNKANIERPKQQHLYKLNEYVCNCLLSVHESITAIAFSKKGTNISICNGLHNAAGACNSLQDKNLKTY